MLDTVRDDSVDMEDLIDNFVTFYVAGKLISTPPN